MAGKGGRPKRTEEVTPILLRLPTALLKRVERCKARLEFQASVSIPRTAVFCGILEAGCAVFEGRTTITEAADDGQISSISEIPEVSNISEVSDISDTRPHNGTPPDEVRSLLVAQGQETGRPSVLPPFDASTYVLGKLCRHGHDYHGTGQSLRRLSDNACLACHRERSKGHRQRKRQAQSA